MTSSTLSLSSRKWLAVCGLALLAGGAACGDDKPNPFPDGGPDALTIGAGAKIEVSPTAKDFGNVVTGGTSDAQLFTASNTGTSPSNPLAVGISGSQGSDFSIVSDNCTGRMVQVGQTCSISVVFKPTVTGAKNGTLLVSGLNAAETAQVTLTGEGVAPGALTLSPNTPSFGSVVVGKDSAAVPVTVTNTGGVTTGVPRAPTITGTNAAEFSVVANTCTAALEPNNTCTLTLKMSPISVLGKSAMLTIEAANASPGTAALSGIGVPLGNLEISPSAQSFGTITVVAANDNGPKVDFSVKNGGGEAATQLLTSISGANPDDFVIRSMCGITLAAGQTCVISVFFNPKTPGSKTALLVVSSKEAGTANAGLSGTALAPAKLVVLPATLDLGDVVVNGQGNATALTVRNEGGQATGAVSIAKTGDNAAEFAVVSDGCSGGTLAGGATCTIQVSLRPTSAGAKAAQLAVSGTPGGTTTSALSGRGTTPGNITANPQSVAFDDTPLGAFTAAKQVTITNSGQSATGALSTNFSGAHPGDFVFVTGANGCQGVALAAGATCTISFLFRPEAGGARTGSLVVSGSPGGSVQVPLTGTGLPPASLRLTPLSSDFGGVVVGQFSANVIFTLTNNGSVATGGLTVTISGAESQHFNRDVLTTCGSGGLAPGVTCTVTLSFRPQSEGIKNATVAVTDGTATSNAVALTGTGLRADSIVIEPSVATFGSSVDDQPGNTQEFTLTNLGGSQTGILSFEIVQRGTTTPSVDFEFITDQNFCSTAGLGGGQSCKFTVRFFPRSRGLKEATVRVVGAGSAATSAISGTGNPKTTIAPPSRDFGSAPAGITLAASTKQTFEVSCTDGGAQCGPFAVAITGADAQAFEVASNSCPTGETIDSGDECEVVVAFRPRDYPNSKSATLNVTVASDSEQDLSAALSAQTRNPIIIEWQANEEGAFTTAAYAFDETGIGQYESQSFRVRYDTGMPVSGRFSTNMNGANPRNFNVTSGGCVGNTITAGSSCFITIIFSPTALSTFAAEALVSLPITGTYPPGTTNVTINASVTQALSGRGVTGPNLVISPAVSTRVTVPAGSVSSDITFTVTNTGDQPANGFAITARPVTPPFQDRGGTCPTADNRLDPNESCTIVERVNAPENFARGNVDGVVTVDASNTPPANATMPATITEQITLSANRAFNDQPAGGVDTVTYTVTNVSQSDIEGGVSPAVTGDSNFALVLQQTTCGLANLPAGQSCVIVIRYTADDQAAPETNSGTLTVTGANGINATAGLTADNLGKADLVFTPYGGPRVFGSVPLNTNSTSQIIEVLNKGLVASGAITAVIAGTNGGDFYVNTGAPIPGGKTRCDSGSTSLNQNQTCVFAVTFAPTAAGARVATFAANGSAAGANAGPIALNGNGLDPGTIRVAPSYLEFAPQPLNSTSASQSVVVTNASTSTTINATPSFPVGSNFDVVGGDCGAGLVAGGTCTVQIAYNPIGGNSGDVQTDVLTVAGFTAVQVVGRVQAPAVITMVPFDDEDELFLGTATVGTQSPTEFTLSNDGDVDATGVTIGLAGSDLASFALSGQAACATVPAKGNCKFTVSFQPQSGNLKNVTLTVNGGAGGTIVQDLQGFGLAQPTLSISPDNADFTSGAPYNGAIAVGGSTTPGRVFTIENNLLAGSTGPISITLAPNAEHFRIDYDDCKVGDAFVSLGVVFPDLNFDCTIVVYYEPKDLSPQGGHTATITVSAMNGAISDTAAIVGVSKNALTQSGNRNFIAQVGTQDEVDITINNDPEAPLTDLLLTELVGANPGQFGINADNCAGQQVSSGEGCTITVRFVPTTNSAATATLRVSSGKPGQSIEVPLVGNIGSPD
jgi:hypothetical protein